MIMASSLFKKKKKNNQAEGSPRVTREEGRNNHALLSISNYVGRCSLEHKRNNEYLIYEMNEKNDQRQ